MEQETVTVTLRLPAALKSAFEQTCKANNQKAAQVMLGLMQRYIQRQARKGEAERP